MLFRDGFKYLASLKAFDKHLGRIYLSQSIRRNLDWLKYRLKLVGIWTVLERRGVSGAVLGCGGGGRAASSGGH